MSDGSAPSPPTLAAPASLAVGHDFRSAAAAVLSFLQERVGLGLWMVTRTAGEDWVVLSALDRGYGVSEGDLFRWSDSFCSRMVVGLGPRIAADSNKIDAYAQAPIGRQVPIGAYVGVPLESSDGQLFGTLCAIDPAPQPASIEREEPLIELLAGLLSNVLTHELRADEAARRVERAEQESRLDSLTGLPNRRAWDALVKVEEERASRYGDPVAVIAIDLDGFKEINDTQGHGAGDCLLARAADVLRDTVRGADVVARLGGDEFAILAVECGRDEVETLRERVDGNLAEAGIPASVGAAVRHPAYGLAVAFEEADAAMYERKRRALAGRSAHR